MSAVSEGCERMPSIMCKCECFFAISSKSETKKIRNNGKTYWQLKHHILPIEYVLNFLNKGAQHIFAFNDVVWQNENGNDFRTQLGLFAYTNNAQLKQIFLFSLHLKMPECLIFSNIFKCPMIFLPVNRIRRKKTNILWVMEKWILRCGCSLLLAIFTWVRQ